MNPTADDELLDSIYVEPLRAGHFDSSLRLLSRKYGFARGVLDVRDTARPGHLSLLHSSTYGLDDESMTAYYQQHWRHDRIRGYLETVPPRRVVFEDDPVRRSFDTPNQRKAAAEISKVEYSTAVSAAIASDDTVKVLIALAREPGNQSVLRPQQRRALNEDLKHLSRGATAFMTCMASRLCLGLDERSMNDSACPAFLVDRTLHIRYANNRALRLIDEQDDLRIFGARLQIGDVSTLSALSAAVVAATTSPPRSSRIAWRSSETSLTSVDLVCLPVATDHPIARGMGTALAVVVVFAGPAKSMPAASFATLFGLTRAEALVATEICQGTPVKRVALRSGVAESTVRAQVQALLRKTGTSRQIELVALWHRTAKSRR